MIRTGEDVAVFVVDVAGDEGREEGQEEVPEPVGGGRQCALLGTRARWESLADQNPDTPANERRSGQWYNTKGDARCPGCCETPDEHASGNDHHCVCCSVE